MKKASRILYIFAILFAIIGAGAFLTLGIMGYAKALPADLIAELTKSIGSADLSGLYAFFIIEAVLELLTCAFCFKGRRDLGGSSSIAGQIVAIVFGAITGGAAAILAGIFGIIGIKSDNK